MSSNIKVSIFCLTYNQKEYIKKALDSMLTQKTDFDFEILVNDDCSTDGTTEIIKEYQKNYPNIIKPVFHSTNQYSLGKRSFILRYLIPKAKGRFFAVCEGDDYWTDESKLQKQVDFLELNKEYYICFHKVLIKYQNHEKHDEIYPEVNDPKWYTKEELLRTNYIQTNSVMYRRAPTYEKATTNTMPADWYLHLYHASLGKIKLIDEVMSVYRKHEKGIWWNYDKNRDDIWRKHGISHLNMWIELLKIYEGKPTYTVIINQKIFEMVEALATIDNKYKESTIADIQKAHPEVINKYIHYAIGKHNNLDELSKKDKNSYLELQSSYKKLQVEYSNLKRDHRLVVNSRLWRIRNKIRFKKPQY